jgi:hypothetical protein
MSAIQITGKSSTVTTTQTTTVAQVHTPATNAETRRNIGTNEYTQRVRSISNGRTPEGMKLSKYSGRFIQGEKVVVPLGESEYFGVFSSFYRIFPF